MRYLDFQFTVYRYIAFKLLQWAWAYFNILYNYIRSYNTFVNITILSISLSIFAIAAFRINLIYSIHV